MLMLSTTTAPLPRPAVRPAPTARPWLISVAPAAVALALGLWGITRHGSMWRDEAATWQVAHRPVADVWRMLGQVDVVHGLYYLVMHCAFEVAGDSLVALRLPSVLATAVAAAATAAVGGRLAGPRAGLAAGLALALDPQVQTYAQEGRSYAMVAAGVAVSTWLLVAAVEEAAAPTKVRRPGATAAWAAWAGVMLVTALLNWFSLLALAAHAVTVLLVSQRHPRRFALLRHCSMATAAVLAGALPLIVFSAGQSDQVSWIRPPAWSTVLGAAALVLVGWLCGRAPYARQGRAATVQVALPLLTLPPAVLLLVSLAEPLYLARYVLYAHIGLALLIGRAVGGLLDRVVTRRRAWLLTCAATAVAFTVLLPTEAGLRQPQSRVDDVLAAAARVDAVSRSGDGVLFVPAARRDTALVSPTPFAALTDLALARGPVASGTLKGIEADPERIRDAMLRRRRIVVVGDAVARPVSSARDAMKLRVLAADFHRCGAARAGGRLVTVYARNGAACADG